MSPFSWLRHINSELKQMNEVPLFGSTPPIQWEEISEKFSHHFKMAISLRAHEQSWKEPSIENGMISTLKVSPIDETFYWIMSKSDVNKLATFFLKEKTKLSEWVREGFYRYFLLETLSILHECEPFNSLTFELEEETFYTQSSSFCIDIEIRLEEKICWGTLIIPDRFRKKWIEHFSYYPSQYRPTELSKTLPLILSVKVGTSKILAQEWETFEEGDFLILDRNSYDPKKGVGQAFLMLNELALFQTKIKHNKLEILQYAFTQEDPMDSDEMKQTTSAQEEDSISLKDLPLTIHVELARLQMTLDQLVHLNPGNFLELPIDPHQKVALTINGKKVAQGELVHLGETLGVRLLELG